jgi:hypothetical protein
VDGPPTCSRLGCDELATAVFGFDARECLVWLDPVGTSGRGAGVLCTRHADRMSPPRGWNLLDRREPELRLWIGRTPVVPVKGPAPARRRERAPLARPCAPAVPRLPFERTRESEPDPAPTVRTPEPIRAPWSPHDRPGPEFERVIDARTPLLARAFEAARPLDETE